MARSRTTSSRTAPGTVAGPAPLPAHVYEHLRQRIGTRVYPPGTRLSETDLAGEFGLSRTPVRQALQRLATDGLVTIRNGVGAIVTDLDNREIDQAYFLRCQLAGLIGGADPRPLAAADLAALRGIRDQVGVMLAGNDPPSLAEFAEHCERFHDLSNNVIGAAMLRDFIETLYRQTDRFWYGWMAQADIRGEIGHFLHEVDETLRALEIHDFEAVGYIRRNHITMMLARMARFRQAAKGSAS